MENSTQNKPIGTLPSIAVILAALGLAAAMIYAYFLAGKPSFANYSSVARWTASVLGLAGFVFLWFYLILEPLVAKLPDHESINRRLHHMLGFLAASLVSLDPIINLITGNWSALTGANAGDHQIYVVAQRLAALLLIGWVVMTARKRDKLNRVPAYVHALSYLAMLFLLVFWKMAGGIYGFWLGKYGWMAFAVSFSILTAWRLVPSDKNKNP